MSFGHALLSKRTSQQLHVLLGLEAKGIQLATRIHGADLPVCSVAGMEPQRYDISQHRGQALLSSPWT